MKKLFFLLATTALLSSCGVKVPYTNQIRDEFSLDTDEKMRQVQFFTSHTIILNQDKKIDSENTTQNGTLVSSSSSKKESIIIPAGTKCVFEDFGSKGEIRVRFELGEGKMISFATKADNSSVNKRYYFDADWNAQGGAKINYGENVYKIDLLRGSPRTAHLLVVKKRLEKSKRKERVVKGMKV
jgi:hypothetical protein